MCGIAGIYRYRGNVDSHQLSRCCEQLHHRGPDDQGIHTDGPVGLAHTRLSIIDLAGGHQPLQTPDGRLTLVVNGEIYNYVELREALVAKGHPFRTHSDSETLLYAYLEYGDEFLRHIQGMFAFALYDSRHKKLLLGRDRLGIKPLFLCTNTDGFTFASELKALRPLMEKSPRVDAQGLAEYMESSFTSGRTTLMEGVQRILPGELVTIDPNGLSRHRYWSASQVQPVARSFDQAAEQFDVLIREVMHQHIRTDVPFGLFLSGGVDSSVLLALLSEVVEEPLQTLSVGFRDESVANELPAAQFIAQRFGAQHREILIDSDQLWRELPATIWAADELMSDYANMPTALLARAASESLKVVFSGEGGDEVFAGYGRYRASPLKRWLRGLSGGGTGGFRTRGTFTRIRNHGLFGDALRLADRQWRQPFLEAWRETPADWSQLQRMQYVDMTTWLPDDLLVKADRMLMMSGVEGRVPFLDHRVVEFGLSLPDHLKTDRRSGKLFLKRWAERYLPSEHLWNPKRGFTVPIGSWLSGAALEKLETDLPRNAGIREWLNPEAVRRLIHRSRKTGQFRQALWQLFQFALWHRIFIEGDGSRPTHGPFELLTH